MTLNNKILPVALVAALLGGSVGAFVMRPSSSKPAEAVETSRTASRLAPATATTDQTAAARTDEVALNDSRLNDGELSGDERDAYRQGFNDGVSAARDQGLQTAATTRTLARTEPQTVVYRTAPRRTRVVSRSNGARRVYYDYSEPRRGRSFWSKHRDKLTVAMGTGAGALIGGLAGGKKGAVIGALAGGGGSALYTYKLRNRSRRY